MLNQEFCQLFNLIPKEATLNMITLSIRLKFDVMGWNSDDFTHIWKKAGGLKDTKFCKLHENSVWTTKKKKMNLPYSLFCII